MGFRILICHLGHHYSQVIKQCYAQICPPAHSRRPPHGETMSRQAHNFAADSDVKAHSPSDTDTAGRTD